MNTSEYIIGLITGIFAGAVGLKFMEALRGEEEEEISLRPTDEFEGLKNALLSHALQVVFPNRDCNRYYMHSGKYLPKYADFSAKSLYSYGNGINRAGIYNFLNRYMPTQEKQIGFFNLYWDLIHCSQGAENEGEGPKNVPGDEEVTL